MFQSLAIATSAPEPLLCADRRAVELYYMHGGPSNLKTMSVEATCDFLSMCPWLYPKALLTCFLSWGRDRTDHSWVWLIHEVWSGFEGRQEWPLGSCPKFFHFGFLSKQMKVAQGMEMRQGYIWWWLLFPWPIVSIHREASHGVWWWWQPVGRNAGLAGRKQT